MAFTRHIDREEERGAGTDLPDQFFDHAVKGVVARIAGNDPGNRSFPIDERDPWFAVDSPIVNRCLFRIFIVINVNESHAVMVEIHQPLDQPVFMDTRSAVDGGTEKNQERSVMKNGVADAFPVQMVRHVHSTEIRVSFPDLQYGIVADRSPGALFGKAQEPVAGSGRQHQEKERRTDNKKPDLPHQL